MSDINRYGTCSDGNGHWGIEDGNAIILSGLVSHDACDAVMDLLDERDAEVTRLKAEVERLTEKHEDTLTQLFALQPNYSKLEMLTGQQNRQIKELKADVERLTKAGDAMVVIMYEDEGMTEDEYGKCVRLWRAAKQGGHP